MAYQNWLADFEVTEDGCGAQGGFDTDYPSDIDYCLGDTVTLTYSADDGCTDDACTATFAVAVADAVTVSCPAPVNMSCASLEAIQEAYENWVEGFVINNPGCNSDASIEGIPELPEDVTCAGANLSYTLHVQDNCSSDECTSTFVVTPCEESCETAFAKLPMIGEEDNPNSECFIDHGFNRWGWTNKFEPIDSTYTLPLYAGAAQCDVDKGMLVGKVEVSYAGGILTVNYLMDDPYYLSEVHVNVGCGMFPTMKNGKETVAPGQFTFNAGGLDEVTEYTVEFSDIYGDFWVIAHGVSCYVKYCSPDVNADDGDYVFDGTLDCNPEAAGVTAEESPKGKGKGKKNVTTDVSVLDLGELKVYPNPFSDVVNIEFVSPVRGHAVLEIHNMVGQKVATLLDRYVDAGEPNKVQFKPDTEVSGFYLYKLDIDGEVQIGKMIYRNE